MSNIFDYLEWRGDITFDEDPFNEVDNLVFAQMAYVLLDGILDEEGSISPGKAVKAFFEKFTPKQVEEDRMRHKAAPFILEKAATAERYRGMELRHYVNVIDEKAEAQMSAVTFRLPDFTYVAFRGTDNSLVGWKEDFNLSYLPETKGQRMAVEYLNRHFMDSDEKLYVGGHSKGGNFAVYASAFCNPSIRERIQSVFSNDGPGFRQEVIESEEYAAVLPKVVSILPESTLVGTLFGGRYDHKIVRSTAEGFAQHDPTTWFVKKNRFVEADGRTEESYTMDEAVRLWLGELSDKERVFFTDALFEVLTANGATSLDDFGDNALVNALDMFWGVYALPKDQRNEFTRMVGQLFKAIFTAQKQEEQLRQEQMSKEEETGFWFQ